MRITKTLCLLSMIAIIIATSWVAPATAATEHAALPLNPEVLAQTARAAENDLRCTNEQATVMLAMRYRQDLLGEVALSSVQDLSSESPAKLEIEADCKPVPAYETDYMLAGGAYEEIITSTIVSVVKMRGDGGEAYYWVIMRPVAVIEIYCRYRCGLQNK